MVIVLFCGVLFGLMTGYVIGWTIRKEYDADKITALEKENRLLKLNS